MNVREKDFTTGFTLVDIYNFNTGKIEKAEYWLTQSDEIVFRLRYALRDGSKKYGCPICKTPVLLKCGNKRKWHFAHQKLSADKNCPLVSSYEYKNRIQEYNYAKESDEHIRLKEFIAKALSWNKWASDIKVEKVVRGQYTPHVYKRPDVSACINGQKFAFEVQLSNTYLADIVERDKFYRQNKIVLVWVFNSFESTVPSSDITKADIYYNTDHLNAFVLDQHAISVSEKRKELCFNTFYKGVDLDIKTGKISIYNSNSMVSVRHLRYDLNTFKPYFRDYQSEIASAKKLLSKSRNKEYSFDVHAPY